MAQELEQELEPKEEQIENLNQQLQEQDGELVEELARASVSHSDKPTHSLTVSISCLTHGVIIAHCCLQQ